MTPDLFARAIATVLVLFAVWMAVLFIRWLWRLITGVRLTDVAHVAGAASAKVEEKTRSVVEAFKEGRERR